MTDNIIALNTKKVLEKPKLIYKKEVNITNILVTEYKKMN
jgi:hypothetical protein